MNDVYYRLTVDNANEHDHKTIMSSFAHVRYDVVLRDGDITNTFIYEIYDKCNITASMGTSVALYSWETQNHLCLDTLSNVWMTAIAH